MSMIRIMLSSVASATEICGAHRKPQGFTRDPAASGASPAKGSKTMMDTALWCYTPSLTQYSFTINLAAVDAKAILRSEQHTQEGTRSLKAFVIFFTS